MNSLTSNRMHGDRWNRQAYSNDEKQWEKSNVLGSLMGNEEDVNHVIDEVSVIGPLAL
jgi:hypothetical protein